MVPLYPRYTTILYCLLRLTTVRAARHAGNKADSISTFKGTLNFEAGVGAAHSPIDRGNMGTLNVDSTWRPVGA